MSQPFAPIPDHNPDFFNRREEPPEFVPLRILVDDGIKEYSIPWPYELRDGDFFAIKSGLALHESLAVRGWAFWPDRSHKS